MPEITPANVVVPEKDGYGNLVPRFCKECGKSLEVRLGPIFQFQGMLTQSINMACPKYPSDLRIILFGSSHTYYEKAGWHNLGPADMYQPKYDSQTGERVV